MPTLERALQIAVQSHAGQKDKSGAAYVFHPIRVMMRCTSADAKIAALLHNVVEDTPVTFEELAAEGFSAEVLSALRLLTHASEVPYDERSNTVVPTVGVAASEKAVVLWSGGAHEGCVAWHTWP